MHGQGDPSADPDDDVCEVYLQDGKLYYGKLAALSEDVDGPWIEVPKKLTFARDETVGRYTTKISLHNRCNRYVSYKVLSTNRELFSIAHSLGVISPKDKVEVLVTASSHEKKIVEKIADSAFIVTAIPIHFTSLLNQKAIQRIWKCYGTEVVPVDSSQCQTIADIAFKKMDYFEDFSILEEMCLKSKSACDKKEALEAVLRPETNAGSLASAWFPYYSDANPELFPVLEGATSLMTETQLAATNAETASEHTQFVTCIVLLLMIGLVLMGQLPVITEKMRMMGVPDWMQERFSSPQQPEKSPFWKWWKTV